MVGKQSPLQMDRWFLAESLHRVELAAEPEDRSFSLELTDIQVNGTRFPILSNDYSVQGSNALGGTASRTARGAGTWSGDRRYRRERRTWSGDRCCDRRRRFHDREGRTDQYSEWDVARIPPTATSLFTGLVKRADRNSSRRQTKMSPSTDAAAQQILKSHPFCLRFYLSFLEYWQSAYRQLPRSESPECSRG